MRTRSLSPSEKAIFRLTHDLNDRDAYAVDLIALVCGIPEEEAQTAWDESSVGGAFGLLSECEVELQRESFQEYVDVLAQDAYLASVMRVCESYRISLTQFSSWSPRDQNLAIAYFLDSRNTCPGCGLAKRLRTEFVRLSSETCVHCQQISEARKSIPELVRDHTHLTIVPEPS